ncbi:carboxypeptidase regulatory-like domain-containing protein [Candidatus Poribacteria bacterium]|nr:carboxypeptidase-like regulatory domain-containing protein [Candidatus Poribacteria bacterium]MXY26895.1 carboxypeptidase regulatory-like domain-containing protein [Candidatus Poribacteria bacterium]MYK17587.1 carboxypeptidase regulatory-like domain-containing protein [Candidatus Poribacteria bacterium]
MHINLASDSSSKGNLQIRYLTVSCLSSLLGVALILFYLPTATAQTTKLGNIQGTVIDRKLEKPLVSHPITLTVHKADTAETQEVLTDENGNYRFTDLPLDPTVHYTVSTVYEDTDYTEKDLVLSTWATNITANFDIGAFTDDTSQIQVRTHTFIIGPPPADHAPDGAVTVVEAVAVENQSDLAFQTKHGTQTVGLHLKLPKGTEGFQPHSPITLTMNPITHDVILPAPLPPGESQLGYTYIFHVEKSKLDLSRRLDFDTAEFYFFVPDGIGFAPNAKFFNAPRREQIHGNVYLVYQSVAGKTFTAGTTVDLTLNVNMNAGRGAMPGQTSNLGQLVLIAVAAALAGGFFVAALFKLRAPSRAESHTDDSITPPDAGWLRKLSPDDIEHVRIARLEFITYLDDTYGKQEISERVYKRLRREQTERLTTLLEQQKRGNNA